MKSNQEYLLLDIFGMNFIPKIDVINLNSMGSRWMTTPSLGPAYDLKIS